MSFISIRSESGADASLEPPLDILQRLKRGTSDIHRRIEERVPVFRPDFGLADYRVLVERFYGFWAPLETKLWRIEALRDAELDLAGRLKSFLLERDLRVLGCQPALVPQCGNLPFVDNFLQGLGCLYVLEGSTLGARVISRHIGAKLRLSEGLGASFFNAYGESVGHRWNDFRTFVTARVSTEDAEEMIAAARQTFECFYEWLGPPDRPGTVREAQATQLSATISSSPDSHPVADVSVAQRIQRQRTGAAETCLNGRHIVEKSVTTSHG